MAHATIVFALLTTGMASGAADAGAETTFAERLGWPAGARVVIFHVDDAGMSHDSNEGTIEAIEKGLATSASIMFPCPWVSELARYVKQHPEADFGIHLTLTSEWTNYRWGPLAGKAAVPGLVDAEGCLWGDVPEVVAHATADEVEKEMRAQLDRCLTLGITPTHLDTHMGTVFATPEYAARYLKLGVETGIPVMIPGGHMDRIAKENPEAVEAARTLSAEAWAAGLPVLDDIHTDSYGWKSVEQKKVSLIEFLRVMKPGVTQIILHCTKPSPAFSFISDSGPTREADLCVMLDPDVRKTLEDEGIVLTTWREMKQRRAQAKQE